MGPDGATQTKTSRRVLIVGGVAGGASCAARLRRLDEDAEILIFERGEYVSFANCGLPYFIGSVIEDESHLIVAKPELFRSRFHVEVRTQHEVIKIRRDLCAVEVRNLQTGELSEEKYDNLVLAPGALPIRPPLSGIDMDGIFVLRTIPDSRAIRGWIDGREAKEAIVVGGGFIGLEMTENLVHRGLNVTLIEGNPQVMTNLDPEMVEEVHRTVRSKGVDLILGDRVSGFEPGNSRISVLTMSGRKITTSMVILGIGVAPDSHLAAEAGLELGIRNGIKVDEYMRTSDPKIFAVGDAVVSRSVVMDTDVFVPLAGPANRQGRIAADNIVRPNTKVFRGVQGTSVCGVFGLVVASTGANEKQLKSSHRAYEKVYVHPPDHATYYPGAKNMHLKLLFDPKDGRVLGAQGAGEAGVEKRIDVLSTVIQGNMTVYDLEEIELCYAPQYGAAKDPLNMIGFVASNFLRGDMKLTHWDRRLEANGGNVDADALPLLIDVREPREFELECVPNSKNIPLSQLRDRIDEFDNTAPVDVFCRVGIRGYLASRVLAMKGIDARNVSGGLLTYRMYQSSNKAAAM
eukprot:Plantae.Rhodophyta-Purpureofilum_apyrenoidigerum.ctg8695.p1 GENE.Plantae.Rhodophyta-Purpureofilum_apyrenoidigerum.ctg8695~~Plantae.Rhodophyta-Purpureofilum_apyrenoidigerum.ctg8695.p1  ORF type:complete len:574 (+),score=107.26 Plantae.Rhodophyta-Purpureofilum_apyrenoidigerum.ctg8695:93-1814(+)